MPPFFAKFAGEHFILAQRNFTIGAISICFILPALYLRNPGKLAKISSLSVACMPLIGIVLGVLCFGHADLATAGSFNSEKVKDRLIYNKDVFPAIGLFVYAAV